MLDENCITMPNMKSGFAEHGNFWQGLMYYLPTLSKLGLLWLEYYHNKHAQQLTEHNIKKHFRNVSLTAFQIKHVVIVGAWIHLFIVPKLK